MAPRLRGWEGSEDGILPAMVCVCPGSHWEGELTAFVFPVANRCLVGWFFATSCGLRISLEAC